LRIHEKKDGGAEGVRTPDLLNAIQALYQLSYDPNQSENKCMKPRGFVKGLFQKALFQEFDAGAGHGPT
jgi:hypothetical protein